MPLIRTLPLYFYRLLLVIAALSMVASCGDDPADDSGVSVGVMTKGSVIVNGTRFEITPQTTITIEGAADTEANLENGMVVRVTGTFDADGRSGSATTVVFADNVEGPVSTLTTIDTNTKQFSVLGQTVIADTQTIFSGTDLATLANDNVVQVSGLIDSQDRLRASRVELIATSPGAGDPVEVTGVIQNLTAPSTTFQINALTVNYASVAGAAPADGQFVEVKGTLNGSILDATAINLVTSGLGVNDAGKAEIEGFVTSVTGDIFTIHNQTVQTMAGTRFAGGLAGDIAVGVKLEAEGPVTGGVLVAGKIKFRDNVKLESDVNTISIATNTLTLKGLSSITVAANGLTEFKGGIAGMVNILANDHIRVRGRVVGTNTVIASEIEKRSVSTNVVLQGPASAISNPTFAVLGTTVNTIGFVDTQFIGVTDIPVGRVEFFNGLPSANAVKAEGTLNVGGTTITWTQVELED